MSEILNSTENDKVTIKSVKVKKQTYEKLLDIKKQHNLSSLNDTILFLIMKLQLCETQVALNESSQY
jgi:hypothetical protein